MREGFDPAIVADPVLIKDALSGYRPLDRALYADIANGTLRL